MPVSTSSRPRGAALDFAAVFETTVSWERQLVARITAGDDAALATVYDQYGALVHGVALRLVGSDTAADICQEVFVSLWNHPDRWDSDRGNLRTFLAMIARRRAIDHLRGTGRRTANEQRAHRSAPAVVPNVDEAALALVAGDGVRRALAALPDPQRRAIELAYFGGLTFRQVAEATGSSEGTAKSRIRLGLRRLSEHLATSDSVGSR
jgi:RNA polymerase sigma factor (sigma-70 family)